MSPWRLVCPRGHSSWERRGDRYWCTCCSDYFPELQDMARDDITRPANPMHAGQGGRA